MFVEHVLGRLAPVRGVFPAVFDEAHRVAVDLTRKQNFRNKGLSVGPHDNEYPARAGMYV